MIGAGADVGVKNDRGEKPVDLVTNESVLALLVSAAQELDKREEEEVRHWSTYNLVLVFLAFSPGCLGCVLQSMRSCRYSPLMFLLSMIAKDMSGELQGLIW